MSKIRQITIPGFSTYYIGKFINGLEINYFKDEGIEFPDSIFFIYRGYTSDNKLVVEFINAPIVVEYTE